MKKKDSEITLKKVIQNVVRDDENITLMETCPILFVHVMLLAVPFFGISWVAVLACLITFWVRVFTLTAGFHRYFSHRSYKTSRFFQFVLAFVGTSSAQLGPIWWASHHRCHHEHSDTPEDVHSPGLRGFFWAHIGWILCKRYSITQSERVGDLLAYPELRFIDRFHVIAPLSLAGGLYALGSYFQSAMPSLHTSGWQMVMWGFFVSTVMTYHVTFMVNSVTHMFGNRRFKTKDDSRNSLLIAFLTMGEGWHNNHHRYPMSVRQGLYWWELDVSYYILKMLSKIGLVWDLHTHPERIYTEAQELKLTPPIPMNQEQAEEPETKEQTPVLSHTGVTP